MAASKVRRVRSEAFSKNMHHLPGVERVAEVFGVVLDRVGELHDGGHLLDGEVGDGAEVAAGEALGGFAEGGVGLNAEGCGRFDRGVAGGGLRLIVHDYCFATHGDALLPALRRRVLR